MEKIILLFQFRTGLPFGYLFFSLFLLLITGLSLKTIVLSIVNKKITYTFFISILGLIFSSSFFYANLYFEDNLELNPTFSSNDIIGTWKDNNSGFELLNDGKAFLKFSPKHVKRLGLKNGSGYWFRYQDFSIKIGFDGQKKSNYGILRVIKDGNEYRIIIEDFDDPDMWDGHLGFKKQKK